MKTSKRLIKSVDLKFFNDDATGTWGLAHKETFDDNNAFNAFWDGMGIFHDVFEHSHEYTNKYFRGDYAMNVGGEMTAMGAMWYYFDQLEMHNRMRSTGWFTPSQSMMQTTLNEVQEAITDGYTRFGHTLESNVPTQKPVENGELEYIITEYWNKVKETGVTTQYEQEREDAIRYKDSVTFRKIADLHRYGYRMAEKLVPNNWENRQMVIDFFDYFNEFCKNNSAEEMKDNYDGMTVKLYKDANGFVTWKAILNSRYPSEIKDAVLDANTRFCAEDYWIIAEEND